MVPLARFRFAPTFAIAPAEVKRVSANQSKSEIEPHLAGFRDIISTEGCRLPYELRPRQQP